MGKDTHFRIFGFACRFAHFSTGELGRASGTAAFHPLHARSKRRAGPRCSHTGLELAEAFIRSHLPRDGSSLRHDHWIIPMSAQALLWYAVLGHDGLCEVSGGPSHVSRFLDRFNRDHDIANRLTGEPLVYRYVVRSGANRLEFTNNIADSLYGRCMLDLKASSADFARLAARPLYRISAPADGSGKTVSRRTTGRKQLH